MELRQKRLAYFRDLTRERSEDLMRIAQTLIESTVFGMLTVTRRNSTMTRA